MLHYFCLHLYNNISNYNIRQEYIFIYTLIDICAIFLGPHFGTIESMLTKGVVFGFTPPICNCLKVYTKRFYAYLTFITTHEMSHQIILMNSSHALCMVSNFVCMPTVMPQKDDAPVAAPQTIDPKKCDNFFFKLSSRVSPHTGSNYNSHGKASWAMMFNLISFDVSQKMKRVVIRVN